MGKGTIKTKAMTMAVAMSMVAGLCPSTVFAASGSEVAADGTYTKTAHVTRIESEDSDDEWNEYDVEVSLTVKDGKFEDITVTPCIFRKNRALAPHERSAVPLGNDIIPVTICKYQQLAHLDNHRFHDASLQLSS